MSQPRLNFPRGTAALLNMVYTILVKHLVDHLLTTIVSIWKFRYSSNYLVLEYQVITRVITWYSSNYLVLEYQVITRVLNLTLVHELCTQRRCTAVHAGQGVPRTPEVCWYRQLCVLWHTHQIDRFSSSSTHLQLYAAVYTRYPDTRAMVLLISYLRTN